jgi:curved DNA-binding protein CbpA
MSGIPAHIEGIGGATERLTLGPSYDPDRDLRLSELDRKVLEQVDGFATLASVVARLDLTTQDAVVILRRLRAWGAIATAGDAEPTAAPRPAAGAPRAAPRPRLARGSTHAPHARPDGPPPVELPAELAAALAAANAAASAAADESIELPIVDVVDIEPVDADEAALLAEDVELAAWEKQRVVLLLRVIRGGDYYELLGVPPSADLEQLRRAYYELSRELHPDRYQDKRLGSFEHLLAIVFETIARTFETLANPEQRAAYDCGRDADPLGAASEPPTARRPRGTLTPAAARPATGAPASEPGATPLELAATLPLEPGVAPLPRAPTARAPATIPAGPLGGNAAPDAPPPDGATGPPRARPESTALTERAATATPARRRRLTSLLEELFETACADELGGDLPRAMRRFRELAAQSSEPRFLRRAARCASKLGDDHTARKLLARAAEAARGEPELRRSIARELAQLGRK